MMFERLSKQRDWLEKMGAEVSRTRRYSTTPAAKMQRNQLLIFSRWCQVMLRFEKGHVRESGPGPEPTLVGLGREVSGGQASGGTQGAGLCAARSTSSARPVYYHNYQMGQLFASQVHHAIARDVYKGADPDTVVYVGNPEVGEFMKQRVFEPGRSLPWNELTKHATGQPLNATAFAADFRAK